MLPPGPDPGGSAHTELAALDHVDLNSSGPELLYAFLWSGSVCDHHIDILNLQGQSEGLTGKLGAVHKDYALPGMVHHCLLKTCF